MTKKFLFLIYTFSLICNVQGQDRTPTLRDYLESQRAYQDSIFSTNPGMSREEHRHAMKSFFKDNPFEIPKTQSNPSPGRLRQKDTQKLNNSAFDLVPDSIEYRALAALYYATNGHNWIEQGGWLSGPRTSEQLNTWYGVNVENGDVVEIYLSSINASGELPRNIGDLTQLRILMLMGNSLEGSIPQELYNLTELRELYLTQNNLTGPVLPLIGQLTNLSILSLGSNWLSDSIPKELSQLQNLSLLDLSDNDFSGSIPSTLPGLTSLEFLYLERNRLTGDVPYKLFEMTSMQRLSLMFNQLTGTIPPTVGQMNALEHLLLYNNSFSEGIPGELGQLASLKLLLLGRNNLTGPIPPELGQLVNLTQLDLSHNKLEGSIPSEVKHLSKLTYFNLSNNRFKDFPSFPGIAHAAKMDVHLNYNNLPFYVLENNLLSPGQSVFKLFDFNPQTPLYELYHTIAPYSYYITATGIHNEYQWTKNGVSIPGQTSKVLNIPPEEYNETDMYKCIITNSWVPGITALSETDPIVVERISAPTDLRLKEVGFNTLTLTWKDRSADENSFVIERSYDPRSGFTVIGTVGRDVVEYTDTGLTAHTTYYYRVKAVSAIDESHYSPVLQAKTAQDIPAVTKQTYKPQHNGNISAAKWKIHGDIKENLYTYHYDPMNRIEDAYYSQGNTVNNTWTEITNQGGFSVHGIVYDLNGNIQKLNRQATGTGIQTIDALSYTYTNGNHLESVTDPTLWAGFANKNTSVDYDYDDNGNMTQDLNKEITSITYNHLNLPGTVTKADGSYIKYLYDATGIKLAQEVYDKTGTLTKKTDYHDEFIYDNDQIQLVRHPEGRIVPNPITGNFDYEYHLEDHLGNTRLTFNTRPKTLEFTLNYENSMALPDDISMFEEVNIISSQDVYDHTDKDGTIYTRTQFLGGREGNAIGSVIALPVAKGDAISAMVFSKWGQPGRSTPPDPLTHLAAALIAAFTGSTGTVNELGNHTIHNSFSNGALIGTAGFPVEFNHWPKAFLNVMFLPEEESIDLIKDVTFAYAQISDKSFQAANERKNDQYDRLSIENFIAPANGYVLVYLSNETGGTTNVHFDDLTIEITESPVVQSDSYYPGGLTFNSYQRVTAEPNRYKFTGKERINDLDLNWDDFGARMYMPEILRWGVVDPLAEQMRRHSPYNYAFNNPIRFIDPDGMSPNDVILKGMDRETALAQLNSGLEGITVSMDKGGKLSYTAIEGTEMNKAAENLTTAIDDHSIEVTINSTMKSRNSQGGVLIGGAFMGNEVSVSTSEDGKTETVTVKTVNEYDTQTGRAIDNAYNKPGSTILHEITEGYEGGKISKASKQSSGPAGTPGSVYNAAHKAASKQAGPVTETYYDNKGNVLPPGTAPQDISGVVWRANGKPIYSIIR